MRLKKECKVTHRGKGKNTPRWLRERVRDKIDYLYKTKYRGFNLTHMTEYLNQGERIKVSPANGGVRQILLEKDSYTKQRRHLKHRQWREPCLREGRWYNMTLRITIGTNSVS